MIWIPTEKTPDSRERAWQSNASRHEAGKRLEGVRMRNDGR
jgi:hypothetical protein